MLANEIGLDGDDYGDDDDSSSAIPHQFSDDGGGRGEGS